MARISADGQTILYSTYLGGSRDDEARGVAIDDSGRAYLIGYAASAAGADVSAQFTIPNGRSRSFSGTTDTQGRVAFSTQSKRGGTWELCVTGVAKAGFYYDPAQNVETCDSIQFP